eukprot:TRINITY_DN35079_c0_g1_i1.p1 TRINITY_DN35079_c0_g1~~TRINITY_DN35079_c0_g1_i1.p1  ORF type:complete len:375 (+),score=62.88 TRINITY_DN35079_c0_g1_i1:93-1217(+)
MKIISTADKGIGAVADAAYSSPGITVWKEDAEVIEGINGELLATQIEQLCGVEFDPSLVGGAENILNSSEPVLRQLFDLGHPRDVEFKEYLTGDRSYSSIGKYDKDQLATALAIVQENSFMGSALPVVFPKASRINHRCVNSNCEATVVGDTIHIVTKEPIAEGQEITIDYCSQELEDMSPSDRSEKLLSERGFTCLCDTCNLDQPPILSEAIAGLENMLQEGNFYKAFCTLQSQLVSKVISVDCYICVKVIRTSREYCSQIGAYDWVVHLCDLEIDSLPPANFLSISRVLIAKGDATALLASLGNPEDVKIADDRWDPPQGPPPQQTHFSPLSLYQKAKDTMSTVYPTLCQTDLFVSVQDKLQETLLLQAIAK